MALIGRKPFIPPMGQVSTPPITADVGLSAAPMPFLQTAPVEVPNVPIAAPKPKINWAGIIADAIAGALGQPGQYAARVNRQQEEQTAFERGEEQYQRHRHDNFNDQMSLLEYQRTHPDDQLTQYMDLAG